MSLNSSRENVVATIVAASVGRFLMFCHPVKGYFTGKPAGGRNSRHLLKFAGRATIQMTSNFGGRPTLPPEQTRDQRIVTFLTRDERRLLEKIASDANVSLSKACRDLIVKSMYREHCVRHDDEPVRKNKQ